MKMSLANKLSLSPIFRILPLYLQLSASWAQAESLKTESSVCASVLSCLPKEEKAALCEEELWNKNSPGLALLYRRDNLRCVLSSLSDFYKTGLEPAFRVAQIRQLRTASYFPERAAFKPAEEDELALAKEALTWVYNTLSKGNEAPALTKQTHLILAETLAWIDTSFLSLKLAPDLNRLTPFLTGYFKGKDDSEATLALYHWLYLLQRALPKPEFRNSQDLGLVNQLALLSDRPYGLVIRQNAIWALGALYAGAEPNSLALVKSQAALAQLTSAFKDKPEEEANFLWTLKAISRRGPCLEQAVGSLCIAHFKQEISQRLFGKGEMKLFGKDRVIFYGHLNKALLTSLYQSTLETRAAFFKLTGQNKPVAGDPNATLKVYIYPSKQAYETYHPFLNDLGTQNGGIYIEQRGSLYTYSRSPSESRYTLDELYRHELTHYLVGRYLVPGMWGEHPLYKDNRMVWFDEGIAEYMVGAESDGKVRPRAVLSAAIAEEPIDLRLKLPDVLGSTYRDGFRFYPYAAQVFSYMDLNDKGRSLRNRVFAALRAGSVEKFEKALEKILKLDSEFPSFSDFLKKTPGVTLENKAEPKTANLGRS